MKKFLTTILIFVIIVLSMSYMLDYVITKGLHYYTSYETEVWNDLRNGQVKPDIIVLGSCQAMHDYNPMILDSILDMNSYVFAMSNLTFPCHNFMWEMYKKYNSNNLPKLIILTLDYGDLTSREIKNTEDSKQFLPLMDEKETRLFLKSQGGYSFAEIYIPCYRYYGNHMMIKHGLISFFTHTGGSPTHHKGAEALHCVYNSHSEWFNKPNAVSIDSSIVSMLDAFVADCRDNEVSLLMTIAPLGQQCSKNITNLNDVYQVYQSIAAKYDVPLLNYSNCDLARDTTNFESPFHLNDFAADLFTICIAQQIDSLNILQQ